MEPAVIKNALVELFILDIPSENSGGADKTLADLADGNLIAVIVDELHLAVGVDAADRLAQVGLLQKLLTGEHHAAGSADLGRTVGGAELAVGEHLEYLVDIVDAAFAAGELSLTQGRSIALLPYTGVVQTHIQQRRNHEHHGDAVLFDLLEDELGLDAVN